MTRKEENQFKTQTFVNQLGGRMFLLMTGTEVKYFDDNKKGFTVMFELKRNASGAKYMQIRLNGSDTYDVSFFRLNKNYDRVMKAEYDGVYNDMLQSIFTEVTGMYTKM